MSSDHSRHAESRLARCIVFALALVGWGALGAEFHFLLGGDRPARLMHAGVQFLSYAFLDADRIGYARVALMVVLLALPFFGLGALVIKLNRALGM